MKFLYLLSLSTLAYHSPLVESVSRAYPHGCAHEQPSYYDYDNYPLPPPNLPALSHDDFSLLRRLGAGKFSDVFEAVELSDDDEIDENIDPSALCVIKCLKPVAERKIKRELLVLSHVSNLPNLARLRGFVIPPSMHPDFSSSSRKKRDRGEMPSLVLEHAGPNARWLCHGRGCDPSTLPPTHMSKGRHLTQEEEPTHLTEYEIKYYLCHLLVALDALHSRGIMHRDVKPRNVLINRRWPLRSSATPSPNGASDDLHRHQFPLDPPPLMLIDLGLADFYLPNQRYNVRVASRHYKAPELLLGNEYYDYGIDMWGVGCVLAGLLLRREPFFRGKDNVDQLGQIVSVLGSHDLFEYCEEYGIKMSKEIAKVVHDHTVRSNISGLRKPWLKMIGSSREKGDHSKNQIGDTSPCPIPSNDSLNLLDKLLVYNHEKRLTAREAMMHPFFDEVRDLVEMEVKQRWNAEQRITQKLDHR